jgi:outer membrane receptor protein involved in Fe transport
VQPPNSAFEQYTRNPRWGPGAGTSLLNSFMLGLGFGAYHDILPEDSTNYDLSLEHEFSGGLSTKITPFYRNTRNQILSIPFNPQSPSFVTGDNFGNARIKGAEFTLQRRIAGASGIGGILNATYTDTKIRFNVPRGGATSFINVINGTDANGVCQGGGICGYNAAYGVNYALLDPAGYYSPSFVMAPTSTGPSYDVRWNINFTPEIKEAGFDVFVPFSYSSGSPYGDALLFADPHCPYTNAVIGGPPVYAAGHAPSAATGCMPAPVDGAGNITHLYYGGNGPDPYTRTFDGPGSLHGPSVWTLGVAVSHEIGHNIKASILGTNLLVGVNNHGYAWEQAKAQNNASYGDNSFYGAAPLGAFTNPGPNPAQGYYGNNYYPYASSGILPYRDWIFAVQAKV